MTDQEEKALRATIENLVRAVARQDDSITTLASLMGSLTARIMKLERPSRPKLHLNYPPKESVHG